MGRKMRKKPERLPEKLFHVQNSLGLSQAEMLRRLGFEDLIDYRRVRSLNREMPKPPLPGRGNMLAPSHDKSPLDDVRSANC